jgi:hypothetical protein
MFPRSKDVVVEKREETSDIIKGHLVNLQSRLSEYVSEAE